MANTRGTQEDMQTVIICQRELSLYGSLCEAAKGLSPTILIEINQNVTDT